MLTWFSILPRFFSIIADTRHELGFKLVNLLNERVICDSGREVKVKGQGLSSV